MVVQRRDHPVSSAKVGRSGYTNSSVGQLVVLRSSTSTAAVLFFSVSFFLFLVSIVWCLSSFFGLYACCRPVLLCEGCSVSSVTGFPRHVFLNLGRHRKLSGL